MQRLDGAKLPLAFAFGIALASFGTYYALLISLPLALGGWLFLGQSRNAEHRLPLGSRKRVVGSL